MCCTKQALGKLVSGSMFLTMLGAFAELPFRSGHRYGSNRYDRK